MRHLSLRRLQFLAAILVLVLIALVLLAVRLWSRPTLGQQLTQSDADASAWAVEIPPERLVFDNRQPDPKLKEVLDRAKGRPPRQGGWGDLSDLRRDWYWNQRAYPLDTIPPDANIKALAYVSSQMEAQSQEQTWQELGPGPIQGGAIGIFQCQGEDCAMWRGPTTGRIKVITFNPQNPSIVYVATAGGGIWKTTDGGTSYVPLTDDQPSQAFHSLVLDPLNPNIIYAGTGEIGGLYGVGILKSTDGGANWTLLGRSVFEGLVTSAIIVHPTQPNIVYAAAANAAHGNTAGVPKATRAVFRSTDGGQSWESLLGCDDCYGFSDLVMEDANPQILYAAAGENGVYKTTDGGAGWTKLTNGLPERGFRRIELGIGHGSGSGVIYAGFDAKVSVGGQIEAWGLIFKSSDHGATWQELKQAPNYCSSQCWYDNIIAVHPTDPDTVLIGGNFYDSTADSIADGRVLASTNGGANWFDMTPGLALNRAVHADMHAISFKPGNPNEIWIGNDGGLYRSTDGGQTWEGRPGNIAVTQFVDLAVHPSDPNIAFGGLQDNAKVKYDGQKWTGMDTGDGGYSEIDPFVPKIFYGSRFSDPTCCQQFQRNDFGGTDNLKDWPQKSNGITTQDRVNFYAPFITDPASSGVLYWGTFRLYRTDDRGESWQAISGDLTRGESTDGVITAIAVAPSDPRVLFTGSSDGLVAKTTNLGGEWSNATGANMPNRQVSKIAIHPTSANTVYVVFNGFNAHTPQKPGHVFKTTNSGGSWQDISGNLPDIPALSIALDPNNPGTIYLGTDIGVFRSINDGASWTPDNDGLATVPVTDLVLQKPTRYLWAATYGRGVFRLNLGGGQVPTATPTAKPGATATPTSRPRSLWLPMTLNDFGRVQPTPPGSGPRPGDWKGEVAEFNVTTDQHGAWAIRVRIPVPGCEVWLEQPEVVPIQNNQFSFEVDLRADGHWTNQGEFTSTTQAHGALHVDGIWLGESCGSWAGDVAWTATWRGQADNPTVTPTPTPRPATPTPSNRSGINGQVRYQDNGIGGINLLLRQCPVSGSCALATSKVAETTSDDEGYYRFDGVPALPAGQVYFVYYFNHLDGGNNPDDRFLWRWFGPDITSYAAGASKPGGDFDIADIHLTGPDTDHTSLPVTFTWEARNLAGERYAWELFDLGTGATKCSSNPADIPSFTLAAANFTGACGGSYGVEYGWFAWAVKGATWQDNQGFGDSYYYAPITFQQSGGPTATPTRTPTRPPATATPTSTPSTGQGISGRVTAANAGAGGITLELLNCDGGACDVESTTTTAGNGNYAFSSVSPGVTYRLRYVNGQGGNPTQSNRLSYWVTQAVGAGATNVNFDIGNVNLTTPANAATETLPIGFTWTGRGVSGDRYAWAIAFDGDEWCFDDSPTAATNFTLDEATADACTIVADETYTWYVYVTTPSGFDGGYGVSFQERTLFIASAAGVREGRFPQAPRPKTPPLPPAGLPARLPGAPD